MHAAPDRSRRTDSGEGSWGDYSAYSPSLPEYDAITWLGIGLAIVANALIAVLNTSPCPLVSYPEQQHAAALDGDGAPVLSLLSHDHRRFR